MVETNPSTIFALVWIVGDFVLGAVIAYFVSWLPEAPFDSLFSMALAIALVSGAIIPAVIFSIRWIVMKVLGRE